MPFKGYDAFDDPYAYRGTGTLKNKLGLKDPSQLEAFELEMSTLRGNEPLPNGRYDPTHYRRIHRHLFQDVYSWAGRYRTIRTAKAGNSFCFPEHIGSEMDRLFRLLGEGVCFGAADTAAFVADAAYFLGELNAIHPFREGNGRTQLAFLHLVGEAAGHPFDFSRVKRATFMPAMVASFDGKRGLLEQELAVLLR